MAILPKKFSPSRGETRERVSALEAYIKYLEEQLELYASNTNKKINELTKRIEEVKKDV